MTHETVEGELQPLVKADDTLEEWYTSGTLVQILTALETMLPFELEESLRNVDNMFSLFHTSLKYRDINILQSKSYQELKDYSVGAMALHENGKNWFKDACQDAHNDESSCEEDPKCLWDTFEEKCGIIDCLEVEGQQSCDNHPGFYSYNCKWNEGLGECHRNIVCTR